MKKSPHCPICRTPALREPWSSNETYRYKGQEFSVSDIEYSVCHKCGFDLVLPHQTRRNEARVRDEHRRIDGLLTARQINAETGDTSPFSPPRPRTPPGCASRG